MLWFVICLMLFVVFGAYHQFTKGRRVRGKRTEHFYALSSTSEDVPSLGPVQRALENLGYDVEIEKKGERIFRDRRLPRDYGEVRMTVLHPQGGGLRIELRSADDGPEFYDEFTRYLIVELDGQLDRATVAHWGMEATPASELARDLTERPLGLATLPEA